MSGLTDDIAELIQRGGYIIIPLLAMSVISLMLIAERTWFWMSLHRPARVRRMTRVNDLFRRGDRKSAGLLLNDDQSSYGRVARALLGKGSGDAVAMEAVENERPRLERFMVSLSTIVTAAPLMGILGTVVGIIRSFRLLGEQSTLTDPRDVSVGIAEALLTTALGLIVALLTLFPYMIFRSQVGRSLGRMESLVAAAQQGADADAASTSAATRAPARGQDAGAGAGATASEPVPGAAS
ncbi:MAG: MotA/TolQ/ExbB proton channel family protein [Planctomycetota bacterium]